MMNFLTILTLLAFLSVVVTLVMGALSMRGKDQKDAENSNRWMRRRILTQFIAIIMLVFTVYMRNKTGG